MTNIVKRFFEKLGLMEIESEEDDEVPGEVMIDETGDLEVSTVYTNDATGTDINIETNTTNEGPTEIEADTTEDIVEEKEEEIIEEEIEKEISLLNGKIKATIAKILKQPTSETTETSYLGDLVPPEIETQMSKDPYSWLIYNMLIFTDKIVSITFGRQKEIDDARVTDIKTLRSWVFRLIWTAFSFLIIILGIVAPIVFKMFVQQYFGVGIP